MKPIWEKEFSDPRCVAFGGPSSEILALAGRLHRGAAVLDLGCGAGRNAIPLARAGFHVTAVDHSVAALRRLAADVEQEDLPLEMLQADVARFEPAGEYDLVIAHGVLHLLERVAADRLTKLMMDSTRPLGWNVVAVFTDRLPQPHDMAPFVKNVGGRGRAGRLHDRVSGLCAAHAAQLAYHADGGAGGGVGPETAGLRHEACD